MLVESIIPGSREERGVVGEVKLYLQDHLDDVWTIDVPVLNWKYKCIVSTSGIEKQCFPLPYSSNGCIEIKRDSITWINNPEELSAVDVKDKVVVMPFPEDPVLLRLTSLLVALRGGLLLVFYGEDNIIHGGLVTGSLGFSYSPTSNLSIPVVSLDKETLSILVSNGGSICIEQVLGDSTGWIVMGVLNGRRDEEIHIISHHDSLIGGLKSTPTTILLEVARSLSKRGSNPRRYTIVFTSLTSREIGDPERTEYSYTWGERYLLRLLDARGSLDRVVTSIALGPLLHSSVLRIHGHSLILGLLRDIGVEVNENTFLLESHPYLEYGVPSITIVSHESLKYRNTSRPVDKQVYSEVVEKTSKLVEYIINKLSEREQWIKTLREHTYTKLGDTSLEIRVLASRILETLLVEEDFRAVRRVIKLSYGLTYTLCLNPVLYSIEASPWSTLSPNTLSNIERIVSECRGLLVIGDSDGYSTIISSSGLTRDYIDSLVKYRVKVLKKKIDYEFTKTLLESKGE